MIYILFGVQDLMLKNRLKKLINENIGETNDFNYVMYDYLQIEISDVMFEATLMDLSGQKRSIVIDNAVFLSKEKSKKALSVSDDKAIYDYIEHPNEMVDLYFIVHCDKIDDKNKFVSKIKEKGKIIQLVNPNEKEWIQYAKTLFTKYGVNASDAVIEEFCKRTSGNAMLMTNEIKKIALYSNNISLDELNILVVRPLEDKILNLFNLIVSNQKKSAIRLYRDLLIKSEEPVAIIGLLATQLRTYIDVYTLHNQGLTQQLIADTLKIHPYRVRLALDQTCYISLNSLKKEIEKLYQLDFNIKGGKVDRFFGLEMYILNFNKNL